ncbi:septum formation initiator family protein [Clostridium niameyense]|uniref:Septum formation initiator family protein n=1 Tax=Clostridium niameyense TaxID=1622073 RepID=A0A6M0RE62_9CLOT|nr:septum formation initiator family protein [Clostridium niameyense]NEZ47688.1 septum formation initiator family protein [Clostridium niameyense]
MKNKFKTKKIILILLLAYVCYIFVSQQFTMYNIKRQMNEKRIELDKAKDKHERLQDEVKLSKSNDYIEKLARERLRLIKRGETPVINNSN